MMTRRNLRALAILLGQHEASNDLVLGIMDLCAKSNTRFQRGRFLAAVEHARNTVTPSQAWDPRLMNEAMDYVIEEMTRTPLKPRSGAGIRVRVPTYKSLTK